MGIKIDVELKADGKSEKLLCCDCPDQQCYDDCCDQVMATLKGVQRAGSAAYYGASSLPAAGKPHGATLSFKATCGKTGTVLADVPAKFPALDDATLAAVRKSFDDCCASVKKVKGVTVK
jgi:hypothetical protein